MSAITAPRCLIRCPFKFYDDEDLIVVVRDVAGVEETQILGTDYTVTGAGTPTAAPS